MGTVVEAGGWGLLAGAALVMGAGLGYLVQVPAKLVATVMAFGSGVLLSAVSFELIDEAHARGGLAPTTVGALAGAVVYTGANSALARRGARHRKRSGDQQPSEADQEGSGTAIALGALLDGIPESMIIGVGIASGGAVSVATVAAVFISNIPEGLSSATGMRRAGRTPAYIFGLWGGIAVLSAAAAMLGFTLSDVLSASVLAAIIALAAGAILTMIADTMIPEAFENAHLVTGLVTVAGFLTAFALSTL
ncbi:ZIP family metal transporter [Nocardia sp. NPDC004340]|uniref:ZIP family metal transporter n=1 Tax=Nocardia sp. CA-136227 TaxID=3239979 RepID=UPI003D976912